MYDDEGRSAVETTDGGFAVAGFTNSFGFGEFDGVLLKTDSLGGLQWAKTYGEAWNDQFLNVKQTKDFGFAACGVSFHKSDDEDSASIYLVKTNYLGETTCRFQDWIPTVQFQNYSPSNTSYTVNNYGITLSQNISATDHAVTVTDICQPDGIADVNFSKNNILNLFPNPATSLVTLELKSESGQLPSFELINQLGQVVLKGNLTADGTIYRSALSLSDFPQGIYEVIIHQDKMLFHQKLIRIY